MLLTVDIGNTNITLGVFEGKKLHVTFRMTTIQTRTSDEYGMVMCELLEHNDVKVEEITDVIVASVVPNVMHSLTSAIIKYFHTKPIIIEAGVKTGIRVASKNPRQVGADRIVDAAAVYELYGGPAIVIDYGTATTFDLVDADGTFTACVIAPRRCGVWQPNCRSLRSRNQRAFWHRIPLHVCRQDLYMDRLVRQNIL